MKNIQKKIREIKQQAQKKIQLLRKNATKIELKQLRQQMQTLFRVCEVNNFTSLKTAVLKYRKYYLDHNGEDTANTSLFPVKDYENKYYVPKVHSLGEIAGISSKISNVRLLCNNGFLRIIDNDIHGKRAPQSYWKTVPKQASSRSIQGAVRILHKYAANSDSMLKLKQLDFDTLRSLAKAYVQSVLSAMRDYFNSQMPVKVIAKRYSISTDFCKDCHSVDAINLYNNHFHSNMLPVVKKVNLHNTRRLVTAMNEYYANHKNKTEAVKGQPFSIATLLNATRNKFTVQLYNYVYHQNMLLDGKHPTN